MKIRVPSAADLKAEKLHDLYETARRIGRLGVREVTVYPEGLALFFQDHRFGSLVEARLSIQPWSRSEPDWVWDADLEFHDGFSVGALAEGRLVLINPYPRQAVRAYNREVRNWVLPRRSS